MIKGVHAMFYSNQAGDLRAFLRDKLGFEATDVGGGWLIFDFEEADMGVHPTDFAGSPPSGTHAISFYCDDIHKTVAELKGRGVDFVHEVEDHGFGFVTHFRMPGGMEIQLYQKKYSTKNKRPAAKSAKASKKGAAKKKAPAKKAKPKKAAKKRR